MLTIRPNQMKLLGEAMHREFELRTLARLRARFGRYVGELSDDEVLESIARGIVGARRHGIRSQFDVTRFIEYRVLYGTDFDSRLDWARAILGSPGLSGREKMDRVDEYDEFEMNRG